MIRHQHPPLTPSAIAATGQHLKVDDKTPMTNLYRSMLDHVGVRTEKIGDSTGKLDALFRA